MVYDFPIMTATDDSSPSPLQPWVCTCCGYLYDPELGDPDRGIPPGTRFEDLPDTWACPLCSALKKAFEPA